VVVNHILNWDITESDVEKCKDCNALHAEEHIIRVKWFLMIVNCINCGIEFDKPKNKVSPNRRNYCSEKCKSEYREKAKYFKKTLIKCSNCGNEFYKYNTLIKQDNFCCIECRYEYLRGENNPNYKGAMTTVKCDYCGVEYSKFQSLVSDRNFCSVECLSNGFKGENAPNWKGGVSFEPYCNLWSEDLRKRVRAFFNNKCVLCGRTKENNRGYNMDVHHVHNNPDACCNDESPRMFVTLCKSCHAKAGNEQDKYEAIFKDIILKNGGKCYYTKEEYKSLFDQ